ncbi:hypothetical protein BJJ97_16010 [Pectobacterium polaris]|nr:hypothetical protein BJJ97_16010 [Pectobacterium polaris]
MLMETQKRRSLGNRHAKKYAIKPTIPSVMTTIEEDAFLGGLDANKVKKRGQPTHRNDRLQYAIAHFYLSDTILNVNVKLVIFRWAINPIGYRWLKDRRAIIVRRSGSGRRVLIRVTRQLRRAGNALNMIRFVRHGAI